MSCRKAFVVSAIMSFFMLLSSPGYTVDAVANDSALEAQVQAILSDNPSLGECYSKIKNISHSDIKRAEKWVRVVCETDVTPNFLYWLEVRLTHIGMLKTQDVFTEGMKVNLDERLYKAIERFQAQRGLSLGGLSYETINALSELDISGENKNLNHH